MIDLLLDYSTELIIVLGIICLLVFGYFYFAQLPFLANYLFILIAITVATVVGYFIYDHYYE